MSEFNKNDDVLDVDDILREARARREARKKAANSELATEAMKNAAANNDEADKILKELREQDNSSEEEPAIAPANSREVYSAKVKERINDDIARERAPHPIIKNMSAYSDSDSMPSSALTINEINEINSQSGSASLSEPEKAAHEDMREYYNQLKADYSRKKGGDDAQTQTESPSPVSEAGSPFTPSSAETAAPSDTAPAAFADISSDSAAQGGSFGDDGDVDSAQYDDEYVGPPTSEELYLHDVEDDYDNPIEAPSFRIQLEHEKSSVLFRLASVGIIEIILLILAVAELVKLPLPAVISPQTGLTGFIIINIVLTLVTMLIAYDSIVDGFIALFKGKPNLNSAVSCTAAFTVLHSIIVMAMRNTLFTGSAFLFTSVAVFTLFLSLAGQYFKLNRIYKNFIFVSSGKSFEAAAFVDNEKISEFVEDEFGIPEPSVCVEQQASFLSDFMRYSESADPGDRICRVLTPVALIGAVIACAVTYFIGRNIYQAATAFEAVMCICSPIASFLACNLQLYSVTRAASDGGTMISGYYSVSKISHTDSIVIDSSRLFPENSVMLQGIKLTGSVPIDKILMYAAAATRKAGGPLGDMFTKVVEGKTKMLPKIEKLSYKNRMGLVCLIENSKVLIGNKSLMQRFKIELPEGDYEGYAHRSGRSIVYIAVDGKLAAVLSVLYTFDDDIAGELQSIERCGLTILVDTYDPNITAGMLAYGFDISPDSILVLPASAAASCRKQTSGSKSAPAILAYSSDFVSFMHALTVCIRLRGNIKFSNVLQTISIVLGYALVVFLSFFGQFSLLSPILLVSFQVVWLALAALIPLIRRP